MCMCTHNTHHIILHKIYSILDILYIMLYIIYSISNIIYIVLYVFLEYIIQYIDIVYKY